MVYLKDKNQERPFWPSKNVRVSVLTRYLATCYVLLVLIPKKDNKDLWSFHRQKYLKYASQNLIPFAICIHEFEKLSMNDAVNVYIYVRAGVYIYVLLRFTFYKIDNVFLPVQEIFAYIKIVNIQFTRNGNHTSYRFIFRKI